MTAKKDDGWYSCAGAGRGARAHYWIPWSANTYFNRSICGLQAYCSALVENPAHHRCKRCEKGAPNERT